MIIAIYFVLVLGLAMGLVLDWSSGIDYPQSWLWLSYALISLLLYWTLAQLQVAQPRRGLKIIIIIAAIMLVPALVTFHYLLLLHNSAITIKTDDYGTLFLPIFLSIVLIICYPIFVLILRSKKSVLTKKFYRQFRFSSLGYLVVIAISMIAMYSLNNYGTLNSLLSRRAVQTSIRENADTSFTVKRNSEGDFELVTTKDGVRLDTGIIINAYPVEMNKSNLLLFSPSKQYVIYDDWSKEDQLPRLNIAKTDGTSNLHGAGQRIEKVDLKLAQWTDDELRVSYCEQRSATRPEKNGLYRSTITIKALTGQSDEFNLNRWSYLEKFTSCPYPNTAFAVEQLLQ